MSKRWYFDGDQKEISVEEIVHIPQVARICSVLGSGEVRLRSFYFSQQFEHSVHDSLRSGWATGDEHVDGYDVFDSLADVVTAFEDAACGCACSYGYDMLRLRNLFVNPP